MKKIQTLFERVIVNHKIVDILPVVNKDCGWVLNGEGIATRKVDGTACAIIEGKLYTRLDLKNSKHGLPEGAIACQNDADSITGSHPYWIPVLDNPNFKRHWEAYNDLRAKGLLEEGTYELCGPSIGTNPEQLQKAVLMKHGSITLEDVPRTFEGIRNYLKNNYMEGIVFHRENEDMAKIKRTDFGFEWRGHKSSKQDKEEQYKKRKAGKEQARKQWERHLEKLAEQNR